MPSRDSDPCIFAPRATAGLGREVAAQLACNLSPLEEREFEDGEHKLRPLVAVRDRDVYVIQSLYGTPAGLPGPSVNDNLCRLLFFIGALKDAAAARVTAIAPYLCYARKDQRTQPRDPVTTRYLAALFEAVGTDRVVTLDVHNVAAFQNAFRCQTENLEAAGSLAAFVCDGIGDGELIVVAPDVGGIKRARVFQQILEQRLGRRVPLGFVDKSRRGGLVFGGGGLGDFAGRTAVVVDDLISSGTTVSLAAKLCGDSGATRVWIAATHGLFSAEANQLLDSENVDRIVLMDTVREHGLTAEKVLSRVSWLPTAPLLAGAIDRLHTGGSIVELLGQE